MTTDHPVTPPPELIRKWAQYQDLQDPEALWRTIATQAAQWGADQELEACCEWLQYDYPNIGANALRTARRPKPPSLKEQALEQLEFVERSLRKRGIVVAGCIRRAIEALPDQPTTPRAMTYPITPPPELVQQWVAEIWREGTPVRVSLSDEHIATCAAQWGADQELEACIDWIANARNSGMGWDIAASLSGDLRAARRPKPPSLKAQALETLAEMGEGFAPKLRDLAIIRRALELLRSTAPENAES